VAVPPLSLAAFDARGEGGDPSAAVRARVVAARLFRRARAVEIGSESPVEREAPRSFASVGIGDVSVDGLALLRQALVAQALGGRGFARALAVARTIADLDGVRRVTDDHVAEALAFRVRNSLWEAQ
jgi:magnesium chelatase family protein